MENPNIIQMHNSCLMSTSWITKENEQYNVFYIPKPNGHLKTQGGLLMFSYVGISENNIMISGGWQNTASYMFEKNQWIYGEKEEHHTTPNDYYVDIRFGQNEEGKLSIDFTTNFIGAVTAQLSYISAAT